MIALLTLGLAVLAGGASPDGHDAGDLVEVVGWAYRLGSVPAILTGLVDHVFAGGLPRLHRAAAAGFAACIFGGLTAMVFFMIAEPQVFAVGVLGLIPGIVCSWLAGRKDEAVVLPHGGRRGLS